MMTPDYHMVDALPQTKLQFVVDTTSTIVAGGAITAHLWLPSLKDVSEVAAEVLPLLGVVLTVLHIVVYARRIWRGRGHS